MPLHRYSPHDLDAYRLYGADCDEINFILTEVAPQYQAAVWNLFWLSVPSLDDLVGAGPNWPQVYSPIPDGLAAVIRDAIEDPVLYRKVMMHPDAFLDWFEREPDYSIYDCYEALGCEKWVYDVTVRADAAAKRITSQRPVVWCQGNAVVVDFRRLEGSHP